MALPLAVIGTGRIFRDGSLPGLMKFADRVYPKYLCDVDTSVIPTIGGAVKLDMSDFGRVLEDKSIAGFIITSPSQFHLEHIKLCA